MNGFEELQATRGPCALLESTSSPGAGSRLTLLARDPQAVAVSDATGTRVLSAAGSRRLRAGPLETLRLLLAETRGGRWPEEGGVVGALAYDFARPGRPAADTPLFLALQVDRLTVLEGETVLAAAPRLEERLADEPPPPRLPLPDPPPLPIRLARWSSLSRDEYHRRVHRLQERIAAGDIYQANLSHRFMVDLGGRSPRSIYQRLRSINPSPFAALLELPDVTLVGCSPERLVRLTGTEVETRPIAGTRPRGENPEEDRRLAEDLLMNGKERAEHLMLVDLERNDLGRVCAYGSVRVDEFMVVERYSHVSHIVSNIRGTLAPGRETLDLVQAVFPGGTVTGVPKVRCMAIIDELEPVRRGPYTGSLGYVSPNGDLDLNIIIRTLVITDGRASLHVGAGIVADSDPAREYQETLFKAEALLKALRES